MISKKNDTLLSKTLSGFIWMFTSTGLQAILQMIVLIVLSRLLEPATFGIVSAALVIINFTNIFTTLGVGPALVQRDNLNEEHIITGFTTTLILNSLLGLIIYISSSSLAQFFNMIELESVLKSLSILFIIKAFGVVSEYLIQRDLNFKLYSIVNAFAYFIYGLVGIILAINNYGVWALVMANISQELVKTIIFIIKRPHIRKISINKYAFKELYYYGSGVSVASIFNQIALQGDNLIVGRYLGDAALGFYSRAYQLMVMPANLFGTVMDKVLFPSLSIIQNDINRVSEWYKTSIMVVAYIVLPISAFIVITAEDIILFLFGSNWLDLTLPVQILSTGLIFRTSYKLSDSLIRAMGAAYRRAWRQAIYAILILIMSYLGHYKGITGVAIGVTFSILINFTMMANLSIKLINMRLRQVFLFHLKPLIYTILIGCLIYLTQLILNTAGFNVFIRLIINGIIFVLTYSITLILMFRLNLNKDLAKIVKQLRKNI